MDWIVIHIGSFVAWPEAMNGMLAAVAGACLAIGVSRMIGTGERPGDRDP